MNRLWDYNASGGGPLKREATLYQPFIAADAIKKVDTVRSTQWNADWSNSTSRGSTNST